MAAGDLSLNFAQGITVLGSIASGGNLALAAPGGSILVGTNGSWNPGGAFPVHPRGCRFSPPGGSMLLSSSAVEVLGSADVSLGGTLSIARASGPVWQFSHTEQVLGSRLWQLNWFRQQETSNASVFNVAERLEINAKRCRGECLDALGRRRSRGARERLLQHGEPAAAILRSLQADRKNTGYRGTVHSAWSATPRSSMPAAPFRSTRNRFPIPAPYRRTRASSAPSVSVGVTDRNTFTAPAEPA